MPLTTGQTLNNRYRIVKLIGQGGFGFVYRAWDMAVKQPIALKENLDVSTEAQRQFQREAAVMAGLRHPNLVRVTDHFLIPGQGQYLVMDFIEGQNLSQRLAAQARPFTESEVLPWIEQICDALTYLHTRNSPIIHRDIKPQNIIITPEGNAMLVDFGISKIYDPVLATTIGAKAVTPGFSPPEQYGSGTTDARTDVYALGATLYALLTAQEPPDSVDVMIGNKTVPPPRQISEQVSVGMEQVILTAMSTTTDRRFQTITDLKAALQASEQSLQTHSTERVHGTLPLKLPLTLPKWARGIIALVVVVAVVGIGFLFSSEKGVTAVTPPSSVTLTAPNKTSTMPIAEDLRFMWEAGYKVTDLAYADKQWSMILSQDAPYGRQAWQLKNEPPTAYIQDKWAEGYRVTSLAYGDAQWAIIMSQDAPYGQQTWQLKNEPPTAYIQEKWAEGYSITNLVYADGQWGIVMSQGAPYSKQIWRLQNDPPADYIKAKWAEGYSVTSLVYADRQWGIVMSQVSPYGRQKWQLQNDLPDNHIDDAAVEGFSVTSLVYANGKWGLVLSQGDVVGRQVFRLMGQ